MSRLYLGKRIMITSWSIKIPFASKFLSLTELLLFRCYSVVKFQFLFESIGDTAIKSEPFLHALD